MIRESEKLQALFSGCADKEKLGHDYAVDFDCLDEYDVVGEVVSGVEEGLELCFKLLEVRKIKGNEEAQVFKVTHGCYGDDDAIMLFIGTEEGLTALFEANQGDNR